MFVSLIIRILSRVRPIVRTPEVTMHEGDALIKVESEPEIGASQISQPVPVGTRFRAHLAITRLDHSIKNVFIIPGIIVPLSLEPHLIGGALSLLTRLVVAFLAATLIASSNYVINEVLDAPFDRVHPSKKRRPAACGLVNVKLAYVQWLLMMATGLALALTVSKYFAITCGVLWFMGCIYNIPPVRTKDVVFIDVLTESINNPLRMLMGWYIVTTATPPASLLLSYWMIGCYFMALKRFSEYRQIGDRLIAGAYRRSFYGYTERNLLVSITFYAASAMLFFGAFAMRYRFELIFSFPAIAMVMAVYFNLAFEKDGAVQNPEKLYREPSLMIAVSVCLALMLFLLTTPLPFLVHLFDSKVS